MHYRIYIKKKCGANNNVLACLEFDHASLHLCNSIKSELQADFKLKPLLSYNRMIYAFPCDCVMKIEALI